MKKLLLTDANLCLIKQTSVMNIQFREMVLFVRHFGVNSVYSFCRRIAGVCVCVR